MSSSEKERVEAMVVSFEEQLSIAHPDVPSFFQNAESVSNDSDETNKDSELRDSMGNVIEELPYPGDFDAFKTAIIMVAEKWKSENDKKDGGLPSTKPFGKSFSLFDQLQGGFAMPVSLDEIEEAESEQQRLVVFQKIKYLEDLFMDWNKICPLLRNDLSESFLADPSLCLQLIDLHRKWFDQGRSSSEYTSLLFGLCENMFLTLAKILSLEETVPIEDASHTHQKTIVISLVQNWKDMWLDLMQRDQYSEELASVMEKSIFDLFWGSDASQVTLLAKRVLASIDPSAIWFKSWANHVSTNDRLISCLCGSKNDNQILTTLWAQVQRVPDIRSDCNQGDVLFKFHSAAILSITLCRTRVSQFPWDAMTNSASLEDPKTREKVGTVIDEMLDLFLHSVLFLSNNIESSKAEPTISAILNGGIEAIISGMYNDSESEFYRQFRKVESKLREENVDYFLKMLLKQRRKPK